MATLRSKSRDKRTVDTGGNAPVSLDLLETAQNAYVTDITSGLVFSNFQTFLCHAGRESIPAVWHFGGIAVFDQSIPEQPPKAKMIYYLPPEDTLFPKRNISLCFKIPEHSTNRCSQDSKFFTESVYDKCNSLHSPVSSRFGAFKNKFCLMCAFGTTEFF